MERLHALGGRPARIRRGFKSEALGTSAQTPAAPVPLSEADKETDAGNATENAIVEEPAVPADTPKVEPAPQL